MLEFQPAWDLTMCWVTLVLCSSLLLQCQPAAACVLAFKALAGIHGGTVSVLVLYQSCWT